LFKVLGSHPHGYIKMEARLQEVETFAKNSYDVKSYCLKSSMDVTISTRSRTYA
jgi:hypothetical protein